MPGTVRARQAARSSGYELAGLAANFACLLLAGLSHPALARARPAICCGVGGGAVRVQQTSVGRADDVAAARIHGRRQGFDAVPDEARIAEKQRIRVQRSQHLR
jgi:hypothetical protein